MNLIRPFIQVSHRYDQSARIDMDINPILYNYIGLFLYIKYYIVSCIYFFVSWHPVSSSLNLFKFVGSVLKK